MKKRKKLKNKSFYINPVIFNFTISFLCCTIIFGSVALITYRTAETFYNVSGAVASSSSSSELSLPKDTDGFTMLISVHSDSGGFPVEFILYRLDTIKKRTDVLSIPIELMLPQNRNQVSAADIYKQGGNKALRSALSQTLSINIDYSCDIGSGSFVKIFDTLGGLYGGVPQNMTYTMPDGSKVNLSASKNQYLSGAKIYAMIASPDYKGGIIQHCAMQETIMAEFIEQKLTGYYIENANSYFDSLFNIVDTDFKMIEIIKLTDAFKAYSVSSCIVTLTPSYNVGAGGQMTFADTNGIKNYFF